MAKGSIYISKMHGLNPSLMLCFYCGEASGVALHGRLKDDAQAPRAAVFDTTPCPKCAEHMKQGIILVSVKDDDPDYRTGGFAVVTEDGIRNAIATPQLVEKIVRQRFAFVPDTVWKALGLPEPGAKLN